VRAGIKEAIYGPSPRIEANQHVARSSARLSKMNSGKPREPAGRCDRSLGALPDAIDREANLPRSGRSED
jgi:hypothetical protein